MNVPITRIIIYTKKMEEMMEFYITHFGFKALHVEGDQIVELRPANEGVTLLLHPAFKRQKEGQVLVKLVFDVKDVVNFCRDAKEKGLDFGTAHEVNGYVFANCKDPSKNSISVSSRAFAGNA